MVENVDEIKEKVMSVVSFIGKNPKVLMLIGGVVLVAGAVLSAMNKSQEQPKVEVKK